MSDLKEVTEHILLEDVLEREGIEYKLQHGSSGEQLNIHECPFCGGNSWKVYANRDTGLGNCFHGSCGQTFNLYLFAEALMDGDKYRTVQYLKKIAEEAGWRPKRCARAETEVEDNEEWTLPDSYELPTRTGQNLRYLLDRRVDGDTAAYFHLRYCPDGWFNYVKPDGTDGGMYFGDRVLIPVYDLDGTMATFQGRDIEDKSDRKYLFPPGLPGTGRFLFNGQNVRGKKTVIVNEGVFDVIRTWMNIRGTKWADAGVVGTFGISLSKGQDGADQKSRFLRLKAEGLRKVVMFWDGEDVAFKKGLKAAEGLRRMGLEVWVARPPAPKDPGDLDQAETIACLDKAVKLDPMTALRLRLG